MTEHVHVCMHIFLGTNTHVCHASGGQWLIEAAFLKESGPPLLEQTILLNLSLLLCYIGWSAIPRGLDYNSLIERL